MMFEELDELGSTDVTYYQQMLYDIGFDIELSYYMDH